jgi:hypothetical protein
VPDHPQYAMWNTRYQAEQAAERERATRRTQRDALQADWEKAWEEYKFRRREEAVVGGRPAWWHVRTWLRILLGKPRRHR